MNRKGAVVRVRVKVPGRTSPSTSGGPRQPQYEEVDQEGNLVFVVELGYRATLFIAIVVTQVVYTYFGTILEAFGYAHIPR